MGTAGVTMSGMELPYLVEAVPDFRGGWLEIDGAAWVTKNVLTGAPMSEVHVAHLDRKTGGQCRESNGSLGLHTLVSTDPLTIVASMLCNRCGWHGFITNGHWVPA